MRKMFPIIAVFLFTGCVSAGRKIDQSKVDQIKRGETTREQVIQWLGSPEQITRDGFGNTMFVYMYIRSSATAATYIPVVGAFAGGANVQNQSTVITFGTNGVVSNVITSYGGTESGTGLASGSAADIEDVEQAKRPK